jgi:hypothetical protein
MNNTKDNNGCWSRPVNPGRNLLRVLKAGPWSEAASNDDAGIENLVRRLRHDEVSRPVIFVGAGTCGLGAGAAATIKAIQSFIASQAIDAEIVEVGCIGICSEEPIVDVQLDRKSVV